MSSAKWKAEHPYYQRDYYQRNKKTLAAKKKARRAAMKLYLCDLKQLRGCADCGERSPDRLDFDHIRNKDSTVSKAVKLGWFLLMAEVQKCEVRCKNCHRVRHREGVK